MVITLIGYRGTGKTTVGAALAQRLGWEFLDLDPEIERQAGLSIAEIFAIHGEPHFRQLESEFLAAALQRTNIVLSPGGGAVLNPLNRQAMQAAGPVVWLHAPVETIISRLENDPATQGRRPSLTGTDVVAEVNEVLQRRLPIYQAAASQVIATDNRTPEQILEDIIRQLPDEIQNS
ncbi:shikimate kinase AroL [Planctomicrobium piriforme]|uniref:Shikimate kinase n=1 Tax=Planctomicrobium piriforme TaxID=1576369 RepID=A0A1I3NEY1_9PLAN|nr:shikimate kinase AroL [Planctomicrobium piriforme]SFJ07677.1 shikimate kinase [Planctomicrobium piriforme]